MCPHCGGQAEWSAGSPDKAQVDLICPSCGRFTLTRAEFDEAVADLPTEDL